MKMKIRPPLPLDSASFFMTATSAFLSGKSIDPINLLGYLRLLFMEMEVEKLIKSYLGTYRALGKRKFEFIVIGPGSGASSNLCCALDAPLLPPHVMIAKIKRMDPDDMESYMKECLKLRSKLGEMDGKEVVIHQDPVHDRPLVKFMLIMRIKFLSLPETYKKFISSHLSRDGTLLFWHCSYPWEWYEVGEKIWFQLGGYGDISWKEYAEGSERIDRWLERINEKHRGGWGIDYPSRRKEESEWGVPFSLGKDVKIFCDENGFDFISMSSEHPLSLLPSYLWREIVGQKTCIIDTFWTYSGVYSGYLPLWIPWPDSGTLRILKEKIQRIKELGVQEVIFGNHPAFGPDIAGISSWSSFLEKHFKKVHLHGYISDTTDKIGLISGARAIRSYINKFSRDLKPRKISKECLKNLLALSWEQE
jgi:hypothetical protein